jgi:hypothetical protein
MIDPSELTRALGELLEQGQVDIHEDGRPLAGLAEPRCEVTEKGGRVMLHLWSSEKNLVRRVLGIAEQSGAHLLLEIERFGRAKPGRIEIHLRKSPRGRGRLTREKFLERFRQLLGEQFPDEDVHSLTAAPDLEHSFSGRYPRGLMGRGQRAAAVLGVSPEDDAAAADAALTFGLLWLAWTREHPAQGASRGSAKHRVIEGLRLFLPAGKSAVTAHRLQGLAPEAGIEIYELDAERWRVRRVGASELGNVASHLTLRRESDQLLAAAAETAARLRALAREAAEAIDTVVTPGARDVAFRFRGLEFARWRSGALLEVTADGRLQPSKLDSPRWRKRLDELAAHRDPAPRDANHPLYRAQGERWLESMVVADPTRIESRLDPRFVYPQLPAFSSSDRAVLDLLGATRDGRLVVIELKVSEDIQLILQALDYWLRVRWHQLQGDFESLGYFSGLELQNKPPLLYVVAPGLRFHPSTDILLRFLSPEIELIRVGLNEHWRRGLQVVFRQER